jgi:hypothetical protein
MKPRVAALLGLLSALVAGCQSETSRDYQSFEQKRQSGYVPPESFPTESSGAETEPLLAEIAPEPGDEPASALAPENVVDGSNMVDLLRVSKTTPATASEPAAATGSSRKVELLIKEREFRPEGPQGPLRITYEDLDLLKILNMDPVTSDAADYFPAWLKGLDGQRVRVRGFMIPTFESTGLERFVLARDAGLCCFGANPKVYDLISVELKPDKPTDYIHLRPFDVVGTFKIDLISEGDKPLGLYWIENGEVLQK